MTTKAGEPTLCENAIRTLRSRHLWKDAAGNIVETPGDMYRRVAQVVAAAETRYGASTEAVARTAGEFYAAMAGGLFLSSSHTCLPGI